ncbi:MAG: hypothetical protein JSV03_17460 [Planctomycetota bacterium]|nr:MAG: hypothetical protein JSV03_17460 [Planctomycetota bacterium]
MSKQTLIMLLIGVNFFLLACLLLTAYSPPLALAQDIEQLGNNYLLITAEAETFNDAVYLLDLQNDRLHVFRTNFPYLAGQPVVIRWLGSRDLKRDFR